MSSKVVRSAIRSASSAAEVFETAGERAAARAYAAETYNRARAKQQHVLQLLHYALRQLLMVMLIALIVTLVVLNWPW